jgi:PAS domain S-box-containing protein
MAAKSNFSELLVDESPDALIAMTPEGKVMYWSKGAETMLGHTRDEAAPAPIECLITPEIRSKK